MSRRAMKNPLSPSNLKTLLVGGGVLAAVGTLFYFMTKPAAAATSSNLVVPSTALRGHRYQITVKAPSALIAQNGNPTVAQAQASLDQFAPGQTKVFSSTTSTGTGGQGSYVCVLDWIGADQSVTLDPAWSGELASKGATLTVTDLGLTP